MFERLARFAIEHAGASRRQSAMNAFGVFKATKAAHRRFGSALLWYDFESALRTTRRLKPSSASLSRTALAGLPNLEPTRSLSAGLSQVAVIFKGRPDLRCANFVVSEDQEALADQTAFFRDGTDRDTRAKSIVDRRGQDGAKEAGSSPATDCKSGCWSSYLIALTYRRPGLHERFAERCQDTLVPGKTLRE